MTTVTKPTALAGASFADSGTEPVRSVDAAHPVVTIASVSCDESERRPKRHHCQAIGRRGECCRASRPASYESGIMLASAIASAAGFAILRRFGRGIPASIQVSISWKSSSIRMSDDTFLSTRPWA